MGLLARINAVIKTNLNDVLDKMTDPAKEIGLLITDMEENLKKAKEEVISAAAAAKRAGKHCADLQQDAVLWQRRAEQAVQAADDQLARQALEKKMSLEQELAETRRAWAEQETYIDGLKSSLKVLEAKIKDIQLRQESLKSRAKMAKEGTGGLLGRKAFEEFDRLENKIEALEVEEDLTASLDGRDASTAAKFVRLEEKSPAIEYALAELKRKLSSTKE